jgi:hypothetical protein
MILILILSYPVLTDSTVCTWLAAVGTLRWLNISSMSGKFVFILTLIRRMNPNTKGKEGWTACEIAATSGVLEVI